MKDEMTALTARLCAFVQGLTDDDARIEALNDIRAALHAVSPLRGEPVDFVRWVKSDEVVSNDYNPNKVATPEMQLLEISIQEDGFTMPIVTWADGADRRRIVVDGFHRSTVGRRKKLAQRLRGYLPTTVIDKDIGQRMASTIRHNRARGKHQVDLMADMVRRFKDAGWSDVDIARYLKMEAEEVLRLKQQTGLASMFAKQEFSRSWVTDDPDSLSVFDAEPATEESEDD